jgi:hypothetical protein
MNKQRHRRRSQGGTSPETTPQTGSGVAHFSVSEVVQFSMSVDTEDTIPIQTCVAWKPSAAAQDPL